MNEHQKNWEILYELFEYRKDLVEKYFSKSTFSHNDFIAIQHELDTTEAPGTTPPTNLASEEIIPIKTFKSCMTDNQLKLLAKLFNEVHLFKSMVTQTDVKGLLNCTLSTPLSSSLNTKLVFLFDKLSYHNLICDTWQNVIEVTGVIVSSSGKRLNHCDLSSTLNKVVNRETSEYISIKNSVEQIAET